jgi:acetolactate synthase-1/2/3 large subunit
MIHQGVSNIPREPFETEFPRGDFVAVARALGADGVRVTREEEVESALAMAMAHEGPFVVDVDIDPSEKVSVGKRNAMLIQQGVKESKK